MNDLIDWTRAALAEAGVQTLVPETMDHVVFEDETVMGFVFAYENVESLAATWCSDLDSITAKYQFRLRSAERKAWNVYGIFLSASDSLEEQLSGLHQIEENLIGARKIARAGVASREDVEAALLSILPIKNSPQLHPIDFKAELRLRLDSLHQRAIDAFLSEANEQVVLKVLEEET